MPIDLPTVVAIEMSDNERNHAVSRNRSVSERICNTHKSTFIVDTPRDLFSKGIRNKVARLTTEFVESEFLLAKQIAIKHSPLPSYFTMIFQCRLSMLSNVINVMLSNFAILTLGQIFLFYLFASFEKSETEL